MIFARNLIPILARRVEKDMTTRYAVALALLAGFALGALSVPSPQAQTSPLVYYVAEIEVTNLEGYLKEYLPRAEANIKAFGGRILAAGTKVASLDGDPPKPRVTIVAWDNIEKVQVWRDSAEAKNIRRLGDRYARARAFTVEGAQ